MNSRVEPWHEHCHGSISPASMKRMMSRLTSERMDHHSTSSGRGCWEHHFLGKLCMLIWCCVCVNYIYILIWSSIWIKNNSIHTYIYRYIYIYIMGGVIHIYIYVCDTVYEISYCGYNMGYAIWYVAPVGIPITICLNRSSRLRV
jgi:hypothetical protein